MFTNKHMPQKEVPLITPLITPLHISEASPSCYVATLNTRMLVRVNT